MSVRLYDIARKLGLSNKDILMKAKEMGLSEAKAPSYALDKITAERLEEEIIKSNPGVAAYLAKPLRPKPKPTPPPGIGFGGISINPRRIVSPAVKPAKLTPDSPVISIKPPIDVRAFADAMKLKVMATLSQTIRRLTKKPPMR